MKNKKGQTIYWEDCFYPTEFRVRQPMRLLFPFGCAIHKLESKNPLPVIMPCIMIGWVRDETHLAWCHQSLN